MRWNVLGHHLESVLRGHLSPHHLIGFGGVPQVPHVFVRDQPLVAAEHEMIEIERLARVSTKIQMSCCFDGHRTLLNLVLPCDLL